MEVLYDPDRWHEEDRLLVLVESHAAFMRWMMDWKARLRTINQWEAQSERWDELVELGIAMVDYYVLWAAEGEHDKYWEPEFVEIEFEIPIPVSPSLQIELLNRRKILPEGEVKGRYEFAAMPGVPEESGQLYLHQWDLKRLEYIPILYQGRIDLIVKDLRTGKYWIVDHKTAAQFGNTRWFDMDTQTRSYGWAAKKMLGINVEGVMFNRMRKKVPVEPDLLASGGLSKNKAQSTTPELYRRAIKRLGLNPNDYTKFLGYFEGQTYVERLTAVHGRDAFDVTEQGIVYEAMDMLGDPHIYPNPGPFTCGNCEFYGPCQAKHDGQDDLWSLMHSGGFVNRNDTEEVKNF